MEENNTELLFTDDDIMKALMKMSPEYKEALLAFGFESLRFIANDTESAKNAVENCDKYIVGWKKAKEAIYEFFEMIHNQTTECVIDEMANTYKELSREERLEFSKKIAGESTLENSLDMLDYNWKHLLGTIQKAVKV